MRIIRGALGNDVFWGSVHEGRIRRFKRPPYESLVYDGREYQMQDVKLLAPAAPSKVVCVGKNYYDHCEEMGGGHPEDPILFIKPNTGVIGTGAKIQYPAISERVDYEAELGIVIGKKARHVEKGQAHAYILGFTCLNDVTARDLQKKDGQWTRAKSFDTFCPIGPWIETEFDIGNKRIFSRLNGEIKQDSNTSLMTHDVDAIVCFISEVMTLLPGDVVATGTPGGIGPMQRGDLIEIYVEGIGTLENTVV